MTMSTSSAPSSTAPRASKALTSLGVAPSGKPTTEHVRTPEPLSAVLTVLTQTGFTQTDLNWYSAASAQTLRISASLASGLSSVWSM